MSEEPKNINVGRDWITRITNGLTGPWIALIIAIILVAILGIVWILRPKDTILQLPATSSPVVSNNEEPNPTSLPPMSEPTKTVPVTLPPPTVESKSEEEKIKTIISIGDPGDIVGEKDKPVTIVVPVAIAGEEPEGIIAEIDYGDGSGVKEVTFLPTDRTIKGTHRYDIGGNFTPIVRIKDSEGKILQVQSISLSIYW